MRGARSRNDLSRRAGHSVSRTVAALVGTIFVALALGVLLALALPLPLEVRYLIGSYTVLPLWVGTACWVFLAPTARRAWLVVLVVLGLAAGLSGAALALGRRAPPAPETDR